MADGFGLLHLFGAGGRSLPRALVVMACLALQACSQDAVVVSDTDVAPEEATFSFLGGSGSDGKAEFSTEDEKVTLSVRFGYNLVATYFLYHVNWIAPSGHIYLRGQIRTEFGTHRELTTEMRIRGEAPSQQPGPWRVQLYLGDRLLTEREFTIRAPTAECPPADEPPGPCIDRLPNE